MTRRTKEEKGGERRRKEEKGGERRTGVKLLTYN
jgi:hypothetical protein